MKAIGTERLWDRGFHEPSDATAGSTSRQVLPHGDPRCFLQEKTRPIGVLVDVVTGTMVFGQIGEPGDLDV